MKLPWESVIDSGFKLIDKLFTSDEEREQAKLQMLKMQRDGDLEELRTSMSAILAEANSTDPWTSRARPAFMYIVYVYLLLAPVFGLLFWIDPLAATAVIEGMKLFLASIPGEMWALFGAGYLGYTHYRSQDKKLIHRN